MLELPLSEYRLPKRRRADVKRSRYPVKSDSHFCTANHRELVTFCRAVGPRNHKELEHIRGSDLIRNEDGSYAVLINKGKGGKMRQAPVIGSQDQIATVISLMHAANDDLVFANIPDAADIHSYRAEYACAVYQKYARPIDELPREDRYVCRGDLLGVVYDKRAMMAVSKALGHSRLDVIAQSYLWALNASM